MPLSSAVSRSVCERDVVGALFDALPDACLYADLDGRIQLASRKMSEYFELSPESMVGKPLETFAESFARCFAETATYHEVLGLPLRDRERAYLRTAELSRPERRFLQIASEPVVRADACVGRLWLMRDVTQEREITELKIRYGGLRATDELKSRFLTVISHQMRTPLNAVRWNLELLLGTDARLLPPESLRTLHDIYRSILNSIAIADDMLMAVEIEQRTLRLDKSVVDVGDVLAKVSHDLSRVAELKSVRIVPAERPEGLPRLFLDVGKIETVFTRLLDNAIRYTPSGGTVEIEARADAAGVSVIVRDRGIGIPEKEQARVFERFYRSERAIALHPNASGLGLFISKYIVEAHDGTIGFDSKEGIGTTFTVTLPKRPAA